MTNRSRTFALGILGLAITGCGDGGTGPGENAPPTLDGVRAEGEWSGATVFPIEGELVPGAGSSTLLVTSDGTDLYLALEITRELEGTDAFVVRFDNDNDDVLTDGDDLIGFSPLDGFTDGHYDAASGNFTGADLSQDGEGAAGQDAVTAFFELSHPLDSGDPDDIAIQVGSTVGLCLRYFADGSTNSGQPGSCALSRNAQATYLDVTVPPP